MLTHRIIELVRWDIVDMGCSTYKILVILSVIFQYVMSNLKFSAVHNNKYVFLVQVHTVSYWLDVVIILQTAGWSCSTYLLILGPNLKENYAQHAFLMVEGTGARRLLESCNSFSTFCLVMLHTKYFIGQSKSDVQTQSAQGWWRGKRFINKGWSE